MGADQFGRDAERGFLQRVRIDDESAGGPARAPGHFRQELGGEPAGAALRAAEGLPAGGDRFSHRLREGDSIGAVDEADSERVRHGYRPEEPRPTVHDQRPARKQCVLESLYASCDLTLDLAVS